MSEISNDHEAFRGRMLYDADGTRALDRCAIETHGVPGIDLMERAGEICFQAMRARWPEASHVTILCGAGNNAGDGYVIARLAAAEGIRVTVHYCIEPDRLRGDAALAYRRFADAGGRAIAFDGELAPAEVIVDALLGTGLDRPVTGAFADAVNAMNDSGTPVLAVDIPSGLHADTGRVMGCAVRASVTPTFIGRKVGLFTASGPACAGHVIFDDLGVPEDTYVDVARRASLVRFADLADYLPPRTPDSHKGTFGRVAVVGGNRGMPGAVLLAGEAALRTGAGMVKIGTHADHAGWLPLRQPALMCEAIEDAGAVASILGWADVLGLGPGLGRSDWSASMFEHALSHVGPTVVDADALTLLADRPRRRDNWVLTPHPGEAARLLDATTAEIQADRLAAAAAIQARYGGACILKGSGSVVASGSRPIVCAEGNPGMATAGMGDVLTGVVAALLAQGLSTARAAVTGACAHAAAGDLAGRFGRRGLIATDVIEALREVVNPPAP